ncbi:hypothetical protein K435DRAFT_623370, partial [Dendrothele bispora CBS 962.96]
EISAWERREIFQLGIGLFNLCIILIWALLHRHYIAARQFGILLLHPDKKRLSGDKPYHHTLLTSLMQIIDGLLLYAWKVESGYSVDDFANRHP